MNYEKIVEQFEARYEPDYSKIQKKLEYLKEIENYNEISKYLSKCVESDINDNPLVYEHDGLLTGSALFNAFRMLVDITVKEFKNNASNFVLAIPEIIFNACNFAFDVIDEDTAAKLSNYKNRFFSLAASILPGHIIRHTIQNKKARAYCITNQLTQALERTRLKGLTAGDLQLPEPLTVVHLIGGMDSIVVFLQFDNLKTPNKKHLHITTFFPKGSIRSNLSGYTYSSYSPETSLQIYDSYDEGSVQCFAREEYNIIKETVRISINSLLYITNNPEDVINTDSNKEVTDLTDRMLRTRGAKREKLKERLRSMPKSPIRLVGRHYVIDKRLQRDPTVRGEADYHLRVRFIVAGHWRKQACGIGRADRRLMWIEPYWKGPEFAPITRSIGVVK